MCLKIYNPNFKHKITVISLYRNDGDCLVEAGGVEPPSESSLTGTSPGAVCSLHSLIRTGADTLPDSVASSMHGTGKAYRTHVLHSNHTRARPVDPPGRMAA